MIGIYKFENKINHQIYIGQSVNIETRYRNHLTRAKNNYRSNTEYNTSIHKAIRKYGINNFDFTVIEECTKEQLNKKERYWIQYYDSYKHGYNETTGGDSAEHSIKFNQDFIQQIQDILINSNEIYKNISNKYNISIGRISEINTGKVGFDSQLDYPLRKSKNIIKYCIDCGKQLSDYRATRCVNCANKQQRVALENMPITREELKQLIRTQPFTYIGIKFNMSDNAIRKWCDKFNLPRTKKEINSYSDEEWVNI